MSQLPVTPDKSGTELSSKLAEPSAEKLTSISKIRQPSLYEPSPANTYGDSAAGSSPPATPLEFVHHDAMAGLTSSMRASRIDSSIEIVSGSPMASHKKTYPHFEPPRDRVTFGEVSFSPSKTGAISSSYCNDSTTSSPSIDRIQKIRESPSWRSQQGNFVRQSGSNTDDPFVSHRNEAVSPGHASNVSIAPRKDRAGIALSNENAQAMLPPRACVFVANLMHTQTDDQLEQHVHSVFLQFGPCYVKIRRDTQGMPFAFVQYEDVDDAQKAITMGRGMLINGRPCRTEVAKVNRSLYLSKVTGGAISEMEARKHLTRYGPIQKIWYCSPTDKEMYRLPEGIWVMYAFFQDCRDAQAGFRDHPEFRLEQPPVPEDIRARHRGRSFQIPISPVQRRSPSRFASPQLRIRQAVDLCSIFVGNLPAHVTEEQLHEMFQAFGCIVHIEIVRKSSVNLYGINAFAFIEYFSAEQAIAAVQASPRSFQGERIRVERKESIDRFSCRDTLVTSGGSPRSQYYADHQDALAMYFRSGMSVGMTQAAQAQAMTPPMYASYPYYQPYDISQYGHFAATATPIDNGTAQGLQSHSNGYMNQPMGQFQYSQAPAQYLQYPQHPTRPSYQWPPTNASNENDNVSPSLGIQSHAEC